MKKLLAAVLAACAGMSVHAATIERTLVRQMWPWNGSVRIEYKISGVSAPMDVKVSLSAGGQAITPSELAGEWLGIIEDGVYAITATLPETLTSAVDLSVTLEPVAASLAENEVIYRIYDLDTGTHEDVTVGEIVSGRRGAWHWATATSARITPGEPSEAAPTNLVWTGFNSDDTYKTSKLVMRRFPAGMARILNRSDFPGTIAKPFWMAVYETTQAQWTKIHGSTPAFGFPAAGKPASNIKYDDVRGAKGPEGNEAQYYWPNDPDPDSFLGKLRAKTDAKFDLPWQALWDYACQLNSKWALVNDRYTADGHYNTNVKFGTPDGKLGYKDEEGKEHSWPEDLNFPGTYAGNAGSSKGYAVVGSYAPSVMGLYDMHGNVSEMCIDWSNGYVRQSDQAKLVGAPNVDLEHPELMKVWNTSEAGANPTGTTRHGAGSAYSTGLMDQTPNYTRTPFRYSASSGSPTIGVRLIVVEDED